MKLSDGEKLILVMLSDVSEKLGAKGGIDPEFVKNAVCSGHTWGLKWEYDGILNGSRDDNPATVNEVTAILTMWRFVEQSYTRLSDGDRQKITDVIPFLEPAFYGFDGNNETEHMSVARFLVDDLGRFAELKGCDLNSHRETLPRYLGMLAEFQRIQDTEKYNPLNVDQLLQIFSAD